MLGGLISGRRIETNVYIVFVHYIRKIMAAGLDPVDVTVNAGRDKSLPPPDCARVFLLLRWISVTFDAPVPVVTLLQAPCLLRYCHCLWSAFLQVARSRCHLCVLAVEFRIGCWLCRCCHRRFRPAVSRATCCLLVVATARLVSQCLLAQSRVLVRNKQKHGIPRIHWLNSHDP